MTTKEEIKTHTTMRPVISAVEIKRLNNGNYRNRVVPHEGTVAGTSEKSERTGRDHDGVAGDLEEDDVLEIQCE
jgi:hypothetical protein